MKSMRTVKTSNDTMSKKGKAISPITSDSEEEDVLLDIFSEKVKSTQKQIRTIEKRKNNIW
jgi:hypothetical protein